MSRPTLEQAKQQYLQRFTMEHVPAWAKVQRKGTGNYYAPQFSTDQEWYDNTLFYGEAGHIGDSSHCFTSNQTWPLGTSLPIPFRKMPFLKGAAEEVKQLADELNAIALGQLYSERVLHAARARSESFEVQAAISRYLNGRQTAADGLTLQTFAVYLLRPKPAASSGLDCIGLTLADVAELEADSATPAYPLGSADLAIDACCPRCDATVMLDSGHEATAGNLQRLQVVECTNCSEPFTIQLKDDRLKP